MRPPPAGSASGPDPARGLPARRLPARGVSAWGLPRWLGRTAAYCVAALIVSATIWVVAQVLLSFGFITFAVVAALLFAALLQPFVRALEAIRTPTWLASVVTVLALLGIIAGAVFLFVNRALAQLEDLQKAVTNAIDDLRELLVGPPLSLNQERVNEARDALVTFVQNSVPDAAASARLLLEFLSGAAIAVFVLFFLLKDGPTMWRWVLSWVPAVRRHTVGSAGREAWVTLTSYVRGTVVIALLDATGIGATLFIVGVPLAAALTLLVFLGAFVPFLGATISGALAVLVTLVTVGAFEAVIVLAAVLIVQQVEGSVLQPFVMGRAVRLHPVAILLAISIGALLAGVVGAIIAVPILAVTYRVADFLHTDPPARDGS